MTNHNSDILPNCIVRFRSGCDRPSAIGYDGHPVRIMRPNALSKTVRIGRKPFTVSGDRRPDGRLRFAVDDINSILEEGEDEVLERFRDHLKQGLQHARDLRQQN